MGLRILVDTNILLDYLLCREPFGQITLLQETVMILRAAGYLV